MGAWASVNGIGQAAGPAMGGFVADAWGWRWVFVPLVPVALAGLIGTLRHIPAYPGTRMRFDLTGACALTFGSGLLILGVALIPAPGTTAVVLALLGVATKEEAETRREDGTLTLNEWFGLHLHPVMDFIAGGVYLTFIGVFILLAAYFTRWIHYDSDPERTPAQRRWSARALVWSFLVVNVLGFATWFLYPAAPPWYVDTYGLDTILLDVPMNPARTVRFDALFGTSFFTGMYGAGSNPFGAIPSLHVSYPVISFVFAMRLEKLRLFTILFSSLVGFAAVYLNHHYLIDVLLGIVYGLVGTTITIEGAEWVAARSKPSGDRADSA